MTPVQIEVMLHYYYSSEDFPPERLSLAYEEALSHLERHEYLYNRVKASGIVPYGITSKGRAYVDKLREVDVEPWAPGYWQ